MIACRGDRLDVRKRSRTALTFAWHPIVVAVAVAALLSIRTADKLARPGFIDEEIVALYMPTFTHGIEVLFLPWSGFLVLIPRLAFELVRVIPLNAIPLLIHILTIAFVAGFISSGRLSQAIPSRGVRLVAAVGLGLLPLDARVFTTVLDGHFFLGLYLALRLLASPAGTGWLRAVDVAIAAIAALDGGDAVLVAPLYAITWRRDPVISIAVLAGGAVQLASLGMTGSDRQVLGVDGSSAVASAILRIGAAPLGDAFGSLIGTAPGWGVAGIVFAAAVGAARHLPSRTLLLLGYLSTTTLAVGLFYARPETIFDFGVGERYLIPATWTLLTLGAAAFPRLAGAVLATTFVVGIAANFWTSPERYRDVSCIGGPNPCSFETDAGPVHWPGSP